MDFKVANFKLGSNNTNYITTNTDEYNNDDKLKNISAIAHGINDKNQYGN